MYKKLLLRLPLLLFIPVTYVLVLLASANPDFVERYYSNGFYKYVTHFNVFQYFPYASIAEIIFFVAIAALVCFLVVFIVRLVRNKENRLARILEVIQKAFIIFGIAYFLFYLSWGFNYSRLPYSDIADLPIQESSISELKQLSATLITRTNEARATLPSAEDGTLELPLTTAELQSITRDSYDKAVENSIPGISSNCSVPKAIAISPLLSYAGISGIYIPYTAESNYNNDAPMPLIGSSICHELAHRQGFAREDEANFISYLVCTNSQNDYLNYSGLLLAVTHSMNKLHERDRQSYNELYNLYSSEVIADLEANRTYWNERSGDIEEAVTNINDAYLKNNNLTDGVASYGRMVDLLLALQRAERQY